MYSKTKKKSSPKNANAKKAAKKTVKKVTKKARSKKQKTKVNLKPVTADIAHQPGHRRMNRSNELQPPKNHLKPDSPELVTLIKSKKTNERRIITGAAVGKTGRIIIKE